ncbi:MAG TPA: 4-alpha-glucanotransferase, partial [Gammaproteobacteria bacterium]|nr:4-alpha-glucanotransferase [Gammaproteobacteria bacterium]
MTALDTLARRCGIALSYPDGRGGEHRVGPDTLQAILGALGIEAATEERAGESLAELERHEWRGALPPVVVARDSAVAVELTLPAATRTVTWHLRAEDGSQRTGEVAFGDLELVARNDGDARPGRRKERRRLKLGNVALGYHELSVEPQSASSVVIVTPGRCHLPSVDDARGLWGLALQLYLLRSERNFGIGDFGDLNALAQELTQRGCGMLGLNPLHAPFPDDPEHASPYSPASRLLLNPLNIDVAALVEGHESPAAALLRDAGFVAELDGCRAAATVQYAKVAALKQRVLRAAYADARARGGASAGEFASFRAAQGAAFERHCLYFALRAHMLAEGLGPGDWHRWPQPYQDSRAAVVARFARTHADEITWVAWQQWLADRQLAAAAQQARDMPVGLYRDLAVGCDAAGAETWAESELLVEGLRIGAPPDPFSATGQEWGLPAPHPQRMCETGYRAFVELLRANMRHAGALRIDHVMALQRLYVIPEGAPASAGAYLSYPREDLVGILALESARQRCVIVGEDLGVVPEGFRERMTEANVLSYRVLRWQRDGQRMFRPHEYPRLAIAVVGNHDLATLRAWWEGADLTLEHEHGGLPESELAGARQARDADRHSLLELLRAEGLLAGGDAQLSYEALFSAVH